MKVPKPRKLKSGTWFLQLRLNGESIPVTGATETECKNAAAVIKAEHRAGVRDARTTKKDGLTIGKAIDDYIAKYEKVLSPATVRGYTTVRRNRFQTYMNKTIGSISDWQAVINEELKTVGPKTVRNGWGLITASIGDLGLPVPSVKLPDAPIKETPFLEPEEIPLFCKALEGDPAEIEVLLELHGLRESEAMAVVKNNRIDWRRNLITVNGAIVPDKNNQFVEKKVNKTKASTRQVPIMIPRLAELVKELEANGKPLRCHSAPALLKAVHRTCEKAGVTDVTNHGLRHTFASLGYSLGLSERMMMDLGGWDDPGTMHKVYVRLARRDKEKARNAITDFFSENANKNANRPSNIIEFTA